MFILFKIIRLKILKRHMIFVIMITNRFKAFFMVNISPTLTSSLIKFVVGFVIK